MKLRRSHDKVTFDMIGYIVMVILASICLVPFVMILSASFSTNNIVIKTGFSILPKGITFEAYNAVFKAPEQILNAYRTSILVTACGTMLMLFLCSMTGYALSRKDFLYRNKIAFFFFFPTLFGGGLVPYYILCVKLLHFKDYPYLAMILPSVFSFFNIIIFRSYITANIPDSISESAKIDGANDFLIYLRLILPMAKPVLATLGLFTALGYWNDWWNAMLFVSKAEYYPLQYFLYKTLNSMMAINRVSEASAMPIIELPTETFKYAVTMVTIGPIILLYPFLQKYFIKGITIGAVKG